jgi:phosphatidylserine decarboxylase
MAKPVSLPVWDRRTGKVFNEFMDDRKTTYESRPGRSVSQWLESRPLVDWFLAAKQQTRRSAREIEPFIRKYRIDMSEFEPVIYRSFAEFFDRKFRPGARGFPPSSDKMGAFAEARYFGWDKLDANQEFPVKGYSLNAEYLLGSPERARAYAGGPVLLARLSPVDYHHVHYPDDGETLKDYRLGRRLWTVNWHALQNKPDILFANERYISILQTRNFGRLAFIEIGALSVGRIVQIHPLDIPFERGAEKSAFRFGGSAVVVFGESGAWQPSEDVLQHTEKGVETFIRLGEPVASRS